METFIRHTWTSLCSPICLFLSIVMMMRMFILVMMMRTIMMRTVVDRSIED